MLENGLISINFAGLNSELAKFPKSELDVLKSAFSSCETRYQFEIRSGGTGKIFYPDSFSESEEFFHELELTAIVQEIEENVEVVCRQQFGSNPFEVTEIEYIRREITSEKLEEIFWEEINQTLEDPFYRSFDDDSEWGSQVYCGQGEVAEFEEFLALCVLTEKEISDPEDYLIVNSGTECEDAGLSDCSYSSERLIALIEIGCEYYQPAGYSYDYNDGWGDRYSGYSMNSETISVCLKESAVTPAREKMLAMIKLRQKLIEMNVSLPKIADLTNF